MSEATLSRRSQLFLLGLLTTIFYVNFFARIVLAPLMPIIEKDLGLGHADAGSFFMIISFGYAAGLLCSGYLSSRLTFRRTIVLASLALGISFFLTALSQNVWMIHFSLALSGIAGGIYLPAGITTITASTNPAHWGKAIAVHELAPALAFFTVPLIIEGLLVFLPWRGILTVVGAASLLLGIIFLRFGPGGDLKGEAPTFRNIRLLLAMPSFRIMAVLFGVAIGCSMGLYSMMTLYLVAERGFDRGWANTALSLSRIPGIAMALTAGWISDRFGTKPTLAAALLFSGFTVVFIGLLPGGWAILMIILQPIMTVCFFPAGFTVLSRIVPPSARNLSVSVAIFLAYMMGAGCIPVVLGAFGDAGAFNLAFVIVGSVIMLSAFLVFGLNVREKQTE